MPRPAGKDIVFFHDTPNFGFDPLRCVRPVISRWAQGTCFMPLSGLNAQRAPYKALVSEVLAEFPQVRVIDPAMVLCGKDRCPTVLNGKLLYHDDGHHLTTYASLYLATALKGKVLPPP